MIILVHGPDAALARAEVSKLVTTHDPDGFNTTSLDGREVSVATVIAAVGSVGFFSAARVVVVTNLMSRATRASASGSDTDEQPAAAGAVDLEPLLQGVPEQNVLILVDPDLAAIPAAVKRAAPSDATVIAAQVRRGRPLVDWVVATAREAGGEIERRAAQLLLELLYPQTWSAAPNNPRYDRPPDTQQLRNDIERLVLYAHPDPVREQHVRDLIETGPNDRVFRFIDAVVAGQVDVATAELERLLLAGEEPAKLVAQVQQQVELAALVAAGPRMQPVEIGREVALSNPNRMSGVASSVRGMPAGVALGAVERATAADRKLKTGRLRQPIDALYFLIAELGRTRPAPSRPGGN